MFSLFKVILRYIGFIFLCSLFSCSESKDINFNKLNDGWYYSNSSKDEDVKSVDFSDFRPLSNQNHLERLITDTEGYLWLKKSFIIPEELKNQELALLLGRITIADKTYLNGDLIGTGGKFPNRFFSNWNQFRFFSIPNSLLHYDKNNELMIKIYINSEGSINGEIILDRRDLVEQKYKSLEFLNSNINILISAVLLIIGAYYLFMFFMRREDKENLYFAVLSIGISIYLTNFFISKVPVFLTLDLSYVNFQKIIFISVFISGFAFVSFVREFLNIKKVVWQHRLIIVLAIAQVVIILFVNNYNSLKVVNSYLQLMLLVPLGFSIAYIIRALYKKNRDVKVLLLGISPFVFTILFDLFIHQTLELNGFIYLAGFGLPLFLISNLFILSGRFVRFHNEAEELNIDLEKKVKERTEDLNSSNQVLGNTLSELEEKNSIAKKDMDMAIAIQEGLFPKVAPETASWSAAHIFKPMSGVSGDLYDYYMKDSELYGLTLLDVSGHGIASGLITMIANTISRRNFQTTLKQSLGKVVDSINDELISEIDNVDNYLTGIFLRFNNNLVEYVNAGHADLIHKSFKTGKVTIVNKKEDDFKGWFLGLADMKKKFRTLQFSVSAGDILFAYSDCLNESTNQNGEAYGVERIIDSISKIDCDSTTTFLDRIMEDFYIFTGTKELSDDMTAIVVKKK